MCRASMYRRTLEIAMHDTRIQNKRAMPTDRYLICPPATKRTLLRRRTLSALLPLALLLSAPVVLAQADAPPDLERARELTQQARELRAEAEITFSAKERTCYERFRVNRCIENARQTRLEQIRQARAMEIESRRIELAEKQRQVAEADLPQPESIAPAEPQPAPTIAPADNTAAEAIRAQREAEAAAAEARAQADRAESDARRAEARARAEASAAERAEQARRDRERYDERIRKRQTGD
jgi:colicin import membrane protein